MQTNILTALTTAQQAIAEIDYDNLDSLTDTQKLNCYRKIESILGMFPSVKERL